eukprot:TRINITY_DN51_c0_g1_i1.p1 TRINITY_DN51_c0_g1~~TRINITY_DN51_c0_g1_i1.p1  ORF type:complete len:198 (-),score=39.01 TRINITY_DN51_c0_g1_i1:124-717(-)
MSFTDFLFANLSPWTLIVLIMALEILMCTFIVLPLPLVIRRKGLEGFAYLWKSFPRFRVIAWCIMGVIFLLFCDSGFNLYRVHWAASVEPTRVQVIDPNNSQPNPEPVQQISPSPYQNKAVNEQIYEAERNLFLCGMTMFMFMVILRFQTMADRMKELEVIMEKKGARPLQSERSLEKEYNLGQDKVRLEVEAKKSS